MDKPSAFPLRQTHYFLPMRSGPSSPSEEIRARFVMALLVGFALLALGAGGALLGIHHYHRTAPERIASGMTEEQVRELFKTAAEGSAIKQSSVQLVRGGGAFFTRTRYEINGLGIYEVDYSSEKKVLAAQAVR